MDRYYIGNDYAELVVLDEEEEQYTPVVVIDQVYWCIDADGRWFDCDAEDDTPYAALYWHEAEDAAHAFLESRASGPVSTVEVFEYEDEDGGYEAVVNYGGTESAFVAVSNSYMLALSEADAYIRNKNSWRSPETSVPKLKSKLMR
jgi:hypothetical protein